jgi:uncharacterized membrane protein
MTKTPKPIGVVERITSWTGSVSSLVVHTMLFAGALIVGALGIAKWETVLLVLTTVVSLEAIYLSLLIQMTVNRNTESLREVEEDIDEIQEDVEELGEDLDEIQEDIEEIQEDVDEIQEDVEEMSEEDKEEEARAASEARTLEDLTTDIRRILDDLEALKKKQ